LTLTIWLLRVVAAAALGNQQCITILVLPLAVVLAVCSLGFFRQV